MEKEARHARILRLRAANVPYTLIAEEVGMSVNGVANVVKLAHRRQRDAAALDKIVRRHERGVQLETLDTLLNPVLKISPTSPADLTRAGMEFRDWLAAVEISRKLKADHTTLFGLAAGTNPAAQQGEAAAEFLTESAKARAVVEWVDGFKYTDPDVHEILMGRLKDSRLKAIGAEHDQFPNPFEPRTVESTPGDGGGPGHDPVADDPGEAGRPAPAEPADARPPDAGA